MFYMGLSNSSQYIEELNVKKVLIQQKFDKIYQFQSLIFSNF